jgi:hypothetical protein
MSELVVLSIAENDALIGHEQVVREGIKDFIRVGLALKAIRDDRLYRVEFDTFEAYCVKRWDMSRPSAYRTIETSGLVLEMSPIGDIMNEGQARALLKIAPDQREEVLKSALLLAESEDRALTAKDIKTVEDPNAIERNMKYLRVKRVGWRALAMILATRPDLIEVAKSQSELAEHLGESKQVISEYVTSFRNRFPHFKSQALRTNESRLNMSEAGKKSWAKRKIDKAESVRAELEQRSVDECEDLSIRQSSVEQPGNSSSSDTHTKAIPEMIISLADPDPS